MCLEFSFLEADPPQSVVYQDEEGRWVTDLAYYTPFDKEQDFNVSLSNELSEVALLQGQVSIISF